MMNLGKTGCELAWLFTWTACTWLGFSSLPCQAQWQRAADQIPSLESLDDATDMLQRQLEQNDGNLELTSRHYRISRPLVIDLEKHGAVHVQSNVGSTLIMTGPGPAIRIKGTHTGTASPRTFKPTTWNERMPVLSGFEVLGADAEADGIELQFTVGAVIDHVSVRWCRHGIRLSQRNRNVIISNAHLYENSGVGIFLDDVNLHQINVSNSHVSYNRSGGIVVRDGNVRNLQVTGCDIEGNMPADSSPTSTANVLIDVSGSPDDKTKSIAEVAITGCTIQHSANYSPDQKTTIAPGGANIRLAGKASYPINSVTISGNVLSDTTTNVDIDHSHDVTLASNTFFAPKPNNLTVSNSQRVVVTGNTFNPRQFTRPGTIRFLNCGECVLANSTIHRFATDGGAIILDQCSGFTLNGLNLSDCDSGIVLHATSDTTIANCRVARTADTALDLDMDDSNQRIRLSGNVFSGKTRVDENALLPNGVSRVP